MKIINDEYDPDFSDYSDLVTKDDWDKYYRGKNFAYNDPLQLAILRALEKLITEEEENEQ